MRARLLCGHSYTSPVNFDTHIMKSFVVFFALVAVVAAANIDTEAGIVSQYADVFPDQYKYQYETSNGIKAEEQGAIQNLGSEAEALQVDGSYSYVGDDGKVYALTYKSGPNGFEPVADFLPKADPIPEYIVRSLEFIAANTKPENV